MVKSVSLAAERYLLDSLNRIAKNPSGYSVLYVSVSKLKPKNRHPEFVKIFARLFDDLVGATNGLMFILSNGDFVILGKNITAQTVDNAVKKLRQGLAADPVLLNSENSDFAHVYNFPEDFNSFYYHLEKIIEDGAVNRDEAQRKFPVTAAQIDGILRRLNNLDISGLVKRQSVMKVGGTKKFEVLFQEFFVAVKDLSVQFDSKIDLVANKWLFLYLTQALDKKTMTALLEANLQNWPQSISLNLNLSSVFTREFVDFAKQILRGGRRLIAEVQVMDILNNLNTYWEAKNLLQRGGHKLLIDAASPEMLHMLNIKRLEPDMVKIFWDPLMEFDRDNEELKQAVAELGRENIIVAKAVDEKAMRWGVSYGINAFQGPYIDNLETALIRAQCPNGHTCAAEDCLRRRRLLAGAFREACENKEFLEKMLG